MRVLFKKKKKIYSIFPYKQSKRSETYGQKGKQLPRRDKDFCQTRISGRKAQAMTTKRRGEANANNYDYRLANITKQRLPENEMVSG